MPGQRGHRQDSRGEAAPVLMQASNLSGPQQRPGLASGAERRLQVARGDIVDEGVATVGQEAGALIGVEGDPQRVRGSLDLVADHSQLGEVAAGGADPEHLGAPGDAVEFERSLAEPGGVMPA